MLWARRDEIRFWPSADADSVDFQRFDQPGECAAVAAEISRRCGHPIYFGWVASDRHAVPVAHCWNASTTGTVLDAAEARRRASGYLGVPLTPLEGSRLGLLNPFLPLTAATETFT